MKLFKIYKLLNIWTVDNIINDQFYGIIYILYYIYIYYTYNIKILLYFCYHRLFDIRWYSGYCKDYINYVDMNIN